MGFRVVIPNRWRERLLTELHREHPGICKMKAICSQLHVFLHREASQELCGLSNRQKLTISSTVTTLGMAIPSVPEGSH